MSPPRTHSTDPDQPMNRAAPSSNLESVGRKMSLWSWSAVRQVLSLILSTYFWATKRGSKKSVVIRWAYMEHAIIQQRPVKENTNMWNICPQLRVWYYQLQCREFKLSMYEYGICSFFPIVCWLPLRIKWNPERTVRRALVVSEPPILVHFIPTKARIAPKKPRHTAAIMRPRQTWM